MIGATLGHYRIVEKIGEGGMGEVYRAHDERLDRDVAIKVLHRDVAQDADRLARFEREAKAVAKLDHPNILAIHQLGTHEGSPFIVTELLDGESLRARIPPSGMAWREAAEIGAAVAEGLAAAHRKNIIHRDLKPENVFITSDGRVKVLDFGLAQVKEPVEEEAETATLTPAGTVAGSVLGTMGYMSPEQLRGEPSDARSDIFAFGCVLYEMLSGKAAFLRSSTAETTAAILKEEPERVSSTGTVLPDPGVGDPVRSRGHTSISFLGLENDEVVDQGDLAAQVDGAGSNIDGADHQALVQGRHRFQRRGSGNGIARVRRPAEEVGVQERIQPSHVSVLERCHVALFHRPDFLLDLGPLVVDDLCTEERWRHEEQRCTRDP
ncbi:serine/threonine protein kinase [bacterium]|nr:serine/threonine protein kinase [bacterium]